MHRLSHGHPLMLLVVIHGGGDPSLGRGGLCRAGRGSRSQPGRFPRQNVDDCVLDEREEYEEQADDHPDVDGLDVGDPRQGLSGAAAHRRSREDREEPDGDTGRGGIDVDPEGHPGQDDDQDTRNVDLDEEVPEVAAQVEAEFKAWIGSCRDRPSQANHVNRSDLLPGRNVGWVSEGFTLNSVIFL